ncbi:netrin receptor UNC5A-like isoform X1 [Watersipora subatra]|uniref:netrin receptor UNC5A-like isoform X1 n=1 Tax=Watersipora subatra TaxID=2589382 RepID=UPI00355BBC65
MLGYTLVKYFCLTLTLCQVFAQDSNEGTAPASLLRGNDAGDEEADSVFTLQPEPIYYVSTNRSATIKCAAKTAAYIHIKCRDTYIEDSEISKSTATINGIEMLIVSSEVTKNTIFVILARYTCVCIAVLDEGERQVRSRAGEFRIAYLENTFPQSPIEISQEFGTETVLICRAPDGTPKPYIFWKKNNVRIDTESYPSKYSVTTGGSLVISNVNAQDEGNYTCVADNEFFTRSTEPAKLHVYRNGGWSQWSNWEKCDTACGNGYQKRWRQCDSPPPSGRDGQRCDGQDVQSSPCMKHCYPGTASENPNTLEQMGEDNSAVKHFSSVVLILGLLICNMT